jgi:maltooligosyltrehalose trehalohydrolase
MAVDYDEDQRWIVMHRGALAVGCNLNADPVSIPVTGEVVVAWGEPTVGADATRLDAHSFAVLRTSH